jgi:hypothetical protein
MEAFVKYAGVVVLLLWGTLGWAEEGPAVRIAKSNGIVEILRSDAQGWKPAKVGDVLERGDRLAANEKSSALLGWSNGSMAELSANTGIRLAGVIFDLESKMENTILDLEQGRIFVKAQAPEDIFIQFKVRMGTLEVRTQGAEFCLTYEPENKSYTVRSLIGGVVSGTGTERIRIEGGYKATIRAGIKPTKDDVTLIDDKTRQTLIEDSKALGGSLLMQDEAEGPAGGKLAVKIGIMAPSTGMMASGMSMMSSAMGMMSSAMGIKGSSMGTGDRRGNAPFKVRFSALAKGGSGKIKSVKWDFGDGETASTKEAEHTFTQGLYVVILRVEDENGEKASAQTGISVEADCGC